MARELFEDKSRAMNMASSSSSSMGFVYPGSDPDPIQIQPGSSDIFSLTNGMEMIGFPKSHHQPPPDAWKAFFAKSANPTVGSSAGPSHSPKTLPHPNNDPSSTGFYGQFGSSDLMDQSGAVSWQGGHVDDDSSLRCVFPCEGNERPSQGLSLSLSSTNPSGIGLQSFELRQTHQNDSDHMRFRSNNVNVSSFSDQMMTMHNGFNLGNSKYLAPAQDLLNEFCSLETTTHQANKRNNNHQKNKFLESCDVDNNGNGSSSSSSRNKLQSPSSSSLYSLDVIELQKRKAKLLSMLEEVDRRYRHYNDQMKAVESVLESAAGAGSATVYSALASKAMSRHFRCLRDGIVGQIQATKKAIGEKDPVAPGASRGETPRLRVLDQTLRQQRAFQQMTMMESHPWRPQRGLPERSVSVLRAWLFEHFLHPYPSDVDKHILARQTGLSRSQVSNWFINARVRLWKPMVEEMYVEETKEQDNLNNNNNNHNMGGGSSDGVTTTDPDVDHPSGRPNHHLEDHKPTPAQLVRIDSECLSSIISNPDKDSSKNNNNMNIINNNNNNNYNTTSYGAMELDFASYNHHHSVNTVSFHDSAANINFNGGVSLTLGLQQHGNNNSNGSGGVSLAFYNPRSSTVHHHHEEQHDQMEPVVQYTMMDGEGQNLPYRNLMGAQLLHDLAG